MPKRSCALSSLNSGYRERQLNRIVEENEAMHRRLSQKRSCYRLSHMLKEREAVEQRINLISEFPYQQMKRSKTHVSVMTLVIQLWMTHKIFGKGSCSNLNYCITNRLGGHPYQIVSVV